MYVTGEQTCHKEVCAPNQVCSFSWIRASWSYFITFMQSQLQNTFNPQVNFHSYPSSDCILVWCCWVIQCVLLFHPMDCSPPGLSVQETFQARILEWVTISFSREYSWLRVWTQVFCVPCIADIFFTYWSTGEPTSLSVGLFYFLHQCLLSS